MAKSTGKLKYDLSLSTTSVYDASSVYINKSAELLINGNANLQYKTIGPTYADNLPIFPDPSNLKPGPLGQQGKAYLYLRNLGPATASSIRLSFGTGMTTTDALPAGAPNGVPDNYDNQQIADISINEFAFIPLAVGPSNSQLYTRSAFVSGSTNWTGATYNEIEYMLCYTTPNIAGPTY